MKRIIDFIEFKKIDKPINENWKDIIIGAIFIGSLFGAKHTWDYQLNTLTKNNKKSTDSIPIDNEKINIDLTKLAIRIIKKTLNTTNFNRNGDSDELRVYHNDRTNIIRVELNDKEMIIVQPINKDNIKVFVTNNAKDIYLVEIKNKKLLLKFVKTVCFFF